MFSLCVCLRDEVMYYILGYFLWQRLWWILLGRFCLTLLVSFGFLVNSDCFIFYQSPSKYISLLWFSTLQILKITLQNWNKIVNTSEWGFWKADQVLQRYHFSFQRKKDESKHAFFCLSGLVKVFFTTAPWNF